MKSNTETEKILYISFNQDNKCFAVGTETGFRIYSTNPLKLTITRDLDGGIGIIEMLYRYNILALVGGGSKPKFLVNKVIIWDDHTQKIIGELKFSTEVKRVRLKKDKIFVICEQKIYLFNFNSFQDIDIFDTFENPRGICSISYDPASTIIAYPDRKGCVRVKSYNEDNFTSLINAHESNVSFLSLNNDGSLLATSSDKGTIIRIFHSQKGYLLQEVRRGKDKATIYSISFDHTNKLIACSSERGTVHIWSLVNGIKKLKEEEGESTLKEEEINENKDEQSIPQNQSSILKNLPGFLMGNFFKSEWSFCQMRIGDTKSICCFIDNNKIVAVSYKGNYFKGEINFKKGGDIKIEEKENFMNKSPSADSTMAQSSADV